MSRPPSSAAVSLTCCGIFHTVGAASPSYNSRRRRAAPKAGSTVVPEAMQQAPVTYDAVDGVAVLTLNRPAVLNALDTELAATLADHAERAAADGRVTVVVVRGAGRAFCSGMDRTALSGGAIDEPFYRH